MNDAPNASGGAAPPAAGAGMAPSLRRRMACWLYEGVLLVGIILPAGLLFSIATGMRHALQNRAGLIAFLFAVLGLYFMFCWRRGQTLAMKTWRIQVVDRKGHPLTRGRALWRYGCSWLWFLPPLAVLAPFQLPGREVAVIVFGWVATWALLSRFHPQRQFWHDALAGTRLVAAPPPAAGRAARTPSQAS
jgi:uncharacterized RDD family membrane protein YckC